MTDARSPIPAPPVPVGGCEPANPTNPPSEGSEAANGPLARIARAEATCDLLAGRNGPEDAIAADLRLARLALAKERALAEYEACRCWASDAPCANWAAFREAKAAFDAELEAQSHVR